MRYLWWAARIGLFVAILGFAVKNADPVSVRYYLGAEWRAPLAFVLLVVFGAGVGLGMLAALSKIFRQRREIAALKRELSGRSGSAALGES
ncbi:MAG TPA: LapA family protein [Burkholderiales bacterium]|nr:LapA family protein [Burkholderiales bacterium]